MFNLEKIFKGHKKTLDSLMSPEDVANLLKTSPEALKEFELAYANISEPGEEKDDLMQFNIKDSQELKTNLQGYDIDIVNRIINEFICDSEMFCYENGEVYVKNRTPLPNNKVTLKEIYQIPIELRPQFTGTLIQRDIKDYSYLPLLNQYSEYRENPNSAFGKHSYHQFRVGLDTLDLDPITYEILSCNPNAMGYWFPKMLKSFVLEGFFKVPDTKILKVPLPLLQSTRVLVLEKFTPASLEILDRYIKEIFNLDLSKEYFVKTGTFSSKYEFRNAHIQDPKEVAEMGEYLWFLSHQAVMMSSYLVQPTMYGASTTNEWVCREYIKDVDNCPCIYNGMPLHTEYRVFVDFNNKEVLGIHPYWDSKVMKERFENCSDSDTSKMKHDSIIYRMHEDTLYKTYEANKALVLEHIKDVLNDTEGMSGQWSIDIMQNGNDFYFIDMALAQESAFYETIPEEKRIKTDVDWIPKITMED